MGESSIITVDKLGKRYNLSHQRGGGPSYRKFSDTLIHTARAPFRWLQIGKRRTENGGTSESFWALKDVTFEVRQGEVLGIIGRNGAGKSTLLKILSRITEPTTGRITLRGRVASLLEVGTGFHPELTGRENIFLNGAILGMKREEIRAKFDEIVDFAGVEKFLDTPVKRYSSGMYVRLAFAVAAHLEPEILIIDEVLAVGDAEFQQKCLGKMQAVAKSGRTVLFVSHNLGQVRSLCTSTVLMKDGQVALVASPDEAIREYERHSLEHSAPGRLSGPLSSSVELIDLRLEGGSAGPATVLPGESPFLQVSLRLHAAIPRLRFTLALFADGVRLCNWEEKLDTETPAGRLDLHCNVPADLLVPGRFAVGVGCCDAHPANYAWNAEAFVFTVLEDEHRRGFNSDLGLVKLPGEILRTALS